jgi:hypothetical protein
MYTGMILIYPDGDVLIFAGDFGGFGRIEL